MGFPDSQWQGQTLRLYSDNSMTVAYIQKKGALDPGLFTKTVELLNLFNLQHINLTQTHLSGSRNVTAVALSRMNSPSPTEWRLPQETFNSLFCVGKPSGRHVCQPIKCLTSLCHPSRTGQHGRSVNALSISWDNLGLVYVFPPAPIVAKTMDKIQKSSGMLVIVILF